MIAEDTAELLTADPLADALIAARLFLLAPQTFGGMVLRGASPARDALVTALGQVTSMRRLPGHVDDERLLGGIDIAASLAAGRPINQTGLLKEAAGGALVVPMAERLDDAIAGRLAQALDEGQVALVLLDDGTEPDDAPPASMSERMAFHCNLTASRVWKNVTLPGVDNSEPGPAIKTVEPLADKALRGIAATATALGVDGVRALLFSSEAARGHAALAGRSVAIEADLSAAVRLVLAPRATRLPPQEEEAPADEPSPDQSPDQPPEEQDPDQPEQDAQSPDTPPPDADENQNESDEQQDEDRNKNDEKLTESQLEDLLVEAATAAIPDDLLMQLSKGQAPRRGSGSGSGQKRKSGMRGKPLGARPGMPRGGARLALIDSLRAAVPWQQVRRRELAKETGRDPSGQILMRKDDLRVRRFEQKAARVTIFAVDASGSAAAARLAESKGAVELMLSQAYVTRSEVALISFRGSVAELLLPPTRSLTRARRALGGLPGGGGTPLAMGLNAARECADMVRSRGRTASLVVLTDGRANIGADGTPGRKQAGEDAEAAAKAIARSGIDALVVDISARPGREGSDLAQAMQGRYLALPRADAKLLQSAISAVQMQRDMA